MFEARLGYINESEATSVYMTVLQDSNGGHEILREIEQRFRLKVIKDTR